LFLYIIAILNPPKVGFYIHITKSRNTSCLYLYKVYMLDKWKEPLISGTTKIHDMRDTYYAIFDQQFPLYCHLLKNNNQLFFGWQKIT